MRRLCVSLSILAILLLGMPAPSRAGGPVVPLYITMHGMVWLWSPAGGLKQISTWAHNHRPFASSDGLHIAFGSDDQKAVEALEALGSSATGYIHNLCQTNILLLDVRDNSTLILAGQPSNGKYGSLTHIDCVARSDPTWSPDGKSLAWTEWPTDTATIDLDAKAGQVVIYDLDKATFRRFPTPSLPAGVRLI